MFRILFFCIMSFNVYAMSFYNPLYATVKDNKPCFYMDEKYKSKDRSIYEIVVYIDSLKGNMTTPKMWSAYIDAKEPVNKITCIEYGQKTKSPRQIPIPIFEGTNKYSVTIRELGASTSSYSRGGFLITKDKNGKIYIAGSNSR